MYRNRFAITLLLALFHLLWPGSDTEAYDENTHRDLSNMAIQNSYLSDANYLKSIGINSIEEEFNSNNPIQWIEQGADEEDSGFRSRNHFHDPLSKWTDAGLNDFFTGQSSLLWAQEASNEFSWQNARQYFYNALTSSSAKSRETGFANTFETLGHLLHLVQDCACPPHTRNDAHVFKASGYEGWAKSYPDEVLIYASPFVVDVDLGVSVEGHEPITQLFDTNQYTGAAPSTSNSQGLAEYTNANFASEDTIFTENRDPNDDHYFPFPGRADTEEYEEDIGGRVRTYFRKTQSGEVIEHFAVARRFYRYLSWWPEVQVYFIGFDDQCHENYAEKLIPRAAGYSSKLLDYFFRGSIDMVPDCETGSGYLIVNNHNEVMKNGTFELYSDNMIEGEEVRQLIWSDRFELGAKVSGNNQSGNIDFTPPDNAKEPGKYMLVFRGQMGSETDAVVGKVVDGIRSCGGYGLITSGSYIVVWDFNTNAVAVDIPLNGGGTATFPCLAADISDWVAGLDAWEGWESLYSSQPLDSPTSADNSTSNTVFDDCGDLTGYRQTWDMSGVTDIAQTIPSGIKLLALNGSEEIEDLSAVYSKTINGSSSSHEYYPGEMGAPCNNEGDCLVFSIASSGSVVDSFTATNSIFPFSDTGLVTTSRNGTVTCEEADACWSGYAPNWTCVAGPVVYEGSLCGPVTYNCGNASHYNITNAAIVRLFTNAKIVDGNTTYDAYGTSNTGLADIEVAPSTMSENTTLSAALLALIEQSTSYGISVTFKQ